MIPRFFVDPSAIHNEVFTLNDREIVHQIFRVLRLKAGDRMLLLDNSGLEFESVVEKCELHVVTGKILSQEKNKNEPEKRVILYQALPKKIALFELVLQKCTEIGVKKIVPLITKRTERDDISKEDRLNKILQEAAEQSGRGVIPELGIVTKLYDALHAINPSNALLLHPSGIPFNAVHEKFMKLDEIHVFIGPEGGFSPEEIEESKKANFPIISLGNLILRTETAPIAISSILLLK